MLLFDKQEEHMACKSTSTTVSKSCFVLYRPNL